MYYQVFKSYFIFTKSYSYSYFSEKVTSYSKSYIFGRPKSYSYKLLLGKISGHYFLFLGAQSHFKAKLNFARKNLEIFSSLLVKIMQSCTDFT